jgi:hypothetical protein
MVKSGAAATVTEMVAVWLSEPDVPTKLTTTGELVLGAVGAAVSVITSGVPGCRDGVEGLAVTPAGRPLIAILIDPLKAFNAELFSVTCALEPAVRATVPGAAVSVKSGLLTTGAPETLRVRIALCVREPDVPTKVTVAGEAVLVAFAAAANVIVCGVPGCRDRVAGLAVTPAGSPLIATLIVPLKLFSAELVSVTCVLAPAASVALVGDTANVKSLPSPLGGGTTAVAVTVTDTVAFALRSPEVPTRTT